MLQLVVTVHLLLGTLRHRHQLRRGPIDRGQSTAEYALVLLGAASVALLLVAWATKTDRVTDLLDGVLDSVLDKVT